MVNLLNERSNGLVSATGPISYMLYTFNASFTWEYAHTMRVVLYLFIEMK